MSSQIKEQSLSLLLTDGQNEVTIRHGHANPEFVPSGIYISGNIDLPEDFFGKREVDTVNTYCVFDWGRYSILLLEGDGQQVTNRIEGQMILNDLFTNFGINSPTWNNPRDLARFIKLNRRFFAERSQAENLVYELSNFSATVKTEIEKTGDDRGNKREVFEKKVSGNLSELFKVVKINIALFHGFPLIEIDLELCFDISGSSMKIWFQCDELHELIEGTVQKAMQPRKDVFDEAGIVIIEKY